MQKWLKKKQISSHSSEFILFIEFHIRHPICLLIYSEIVDFNFFPLLGLTAEWGKNNRFRLIKP